MTDRRGPESAALRTAELSTYRALRMATDPLGGLVARAADSDVVTASIGRKRLALALSPEAVRSMFTQPELFIADAFRELRMGSDSSMRRLASGLLKLNGQEHRRHRAIMKPAFAIRRVDGHADQIARCAMDAVKRIPVGAPVDVSALLSRLTLDIALRTIFALSVEDEEGTRLHQLTTELLRWGSNPLSFLVPVPVPGFPYSRLCKAAEELESKLVRIVRARRDARTDGSDVLSLLVSSAGSAAEGLSEDELVAEAYTAFCHESSAAALSWTLLLLDQNPHILETVAEEVGRVVTPGELPSVDALSALPMLDRVIAESLRLFPPAAFSLRYAATDGSLIGVPVRRGTTVVFSPFASHRRSTSFPDPLRFTPERWLGARPSTYEYFPFGAGPHNCLGRSFALLEMRTVLATWLPMLSLRTPAPVQVDPAIRISLVPRNHLWMERRAAADRRYPMPITGGIRRFVTLGEG